MSLSAPVKRQLKHTRQVTCCGYARDDGLWDIEAHLQDTKTDDIPAQHGGRLFPKGGPIHGMWVRVTIDSSLHVKAIEVSMEHTPYKQCASIEAAFQTIVGERIGAGWRKVIHQRLGGINGCTHIVELLGPIATTAYQTLYKVIHETTGAVPLNGCHVWADDGKLVKEFHPQFYRTTPVSGS